MSLHQLGVTSRIHHLNLDEALAFKKLLLQQPTLDRTNLALTFYRLAQLDKATAVRELAKLEGFERQETHCINLLIELASAKGNLSALAGCFSPEQEDHGRIGLIDGDDLAEYYHYLCALKEPETYRKQFIAGADIGLEIYAAAMLRRGEIKKLSDLRLHDSIDEEWLDEEIVAMLPFLDYPVAKEWFDANRQRLYKQYEGDVSWLHRCERRLHYVKHRYEENKHWLSPSVKDLLFEYFVGWPTPMLHVEKLENLSDSEMESLLGLAKTVAETGSDFAARSLLLETASYLYASRDPLKTYQLTIDESYDAFRLDLALVLIAMLEQHQELAIREYEKLCKWPLVVPIGLYIPTVNALAFDFMYRLTKQDPVRALKLGGKTLIYPRTGWGILEPSGLVGLIMALVEDDKIDLLLEWIKPLSDEEKIDFCHDIIEVASQTNITKAYALAKQFDQTFPDQDYGEDIIWDAFDHAKPDTIFSWLDGRNDLPKYEDETADQTAKRIEKNYFEVLASNNPHLAYQLARKRGMLKVVQKKLSD